MNLFNLYLLVDFINLALSLEIFQFKVISCSKLLQNHKSSFNVCLKIVKKKVKTTF